MNISGVVLAGGASRRMGRDKALVEVGGIPMARRVADALRAAGCDPVWCQGGDIEALGVIGLDVRPDPRPLCGPLEAIVAASRAAGSTIVVAACDLAWLDADTVRQLLDVARQRPEQISVARDAGGTHLLAVWPAATVPPTERLIAEGVVSYRAALQRLGAREVEVASTAVRNANRPTDLDEPG